MRPLTTPALLAVAWSLAMAAGPAAAARAAAAATGTAIPAAPLAGPVVAGGDTVWASPREQGGFDLLAAAPGGPVRTVEKFPSFTDPGGHQVDLDPQLSSAGSQVALAIDEWPLPVNRYEDVSGSDGSEVLTGPPDGPLAPVLKCRPGLPDGVTAALADDAFVLSGPGCGDARATGIALRGPDGTLTPLAPSAGRVRAAGSLAGWVDRDGDVVVYDASRAAVVYRIDNPSGSEIRDWDLQADGKVALALAPNVNSPATLSWYSPEAPTPHSLGLPAAHDWQVRIAADSIAYLRSSVASGGYYFSPVVVTGLDGRTRTVANRAIGLDGSHSGLAFDGSKVTWAAPACFGARLYSQPAGAHAVNTPRPSCPLRFKTRPRMLSKGVVSVALRCSGFVLPDCGGSEVSLRAVKQHVWLGSEQSSFCDATADVYLTRRGSALVRRFKRLRVKATATDFEPDGRREVRSTTFTLKTRGPRARPSTCEDEG